MFRNANWFAMFALFTVFCGAYVDARKAAAAPGCDNKCHNIYITLQCPAGGDCLESTYKDCRYCSAGAIKYLCTSNLFANSTCDTPVTGPQTNCFAHGTCMELCSCSDSSNPVAVEGGNWVSGTGGNFVASLLCQ
jgi:hypothetical protein